MPRRRVDKVVEHRVSLSDFERAQLKETIDTQQANVAIDGITATLQAAGSAMAGGGLLLGAAVLMMWKAPGIIATVTDKTNSIFDGIADVFLPGTPVEHRRYAQDLAKRRGEIAKEEASFCTFSSSSYDEARCSQTQIKKDQYFTDRAAFYSMLMTTYERGVREVIYYGLGDVNPNFVE